MFLKSKKKFQKFTPQNYSRSSWTVHELGPPQEPFGFVDPLVRVHEPRDFWHGCRIGPIRMDLSDVRPWKPWFCWRWCSSERVQWSRQRRKVVALLLGRFPRGVVAGGRGGKRHIPIFVCHISWSPSFEGQCNARHQCAMLEPFFFGSMWFMSLSLSLLGSDPLVASPAMRASLRYQSWACVTSHQFFILNNYYVLFEQMAIAKGEDDKSHVLARESSEYMSNSLSLHCNPQSASCPLLPHQIRQAKKRMVRNSATGL